MVWELFHTFLYNRKAIYFKFRQKLKRELLNKMNKENR